MNNPCANKHVICIENLSYAYPDNAKGAVSDVSFCVNKGEFFSLLGPSGCGKTTLLRLIAGLIKPQEGEINFHMGDGKIGMVFQDLALFPHMSVARNVGFGLRDISRAERRDRADEYLELVGLKDHRTKYPHELSGGQKQRLALARALAPNPALLLLDEPFASQDVYLRESLRDDVLHILKERGVAALMVTHDPEEAMFLSDRIGVMRDGHMQQIGTPEELYTKPADPFVTGLFGSINTLDGVVEGTIVKTQLGSVPVQGLSDGQNVQIVFRPEALQLSSHDPIVDHNDPKHAHTHCTVSEARILKNSTFLHLDACDENGIENGQHFHARVPGIFKDTDKQVQDVFLDPSKIYVFPKDA